MASALFLLTFGLLVFYIVEAVPPLQSPRRQILSYLQNPTGGNGQANRIIDHYMIDAQNNKIPLATTEARLKGAVQYYNPTDVTKWYLMLLTILLNSVYVFI